MGSSRASVYASSTDLRSLHLRDKIRAEWRDVIKKLPPSRRKSFLRKPEAIAALGARQCNELIKSIDHLHDRVSDLVPSAAWLDAWDFEGLQLPPSVTAAGHRIRGAMVLSRHLTRFGMGGKASRRYTPAAAVGVEDLLDGMSPTPAMHYEFPASPSSIAIERIRAVRAKENRVELKLRRPKATSREVAAHYGGVLRAV